MTEHQEHRATIIAHNEQADAARKLELWFFRDMSDEQRLKLLALFGLAVKGSETHGAQKLALRRILSSLAPLYVTPPAATAKCAIKPMRLSDGRTDYFVSIKRDDREVTPHVFSDEYKAAYHVALYNWLLNGEAKPDLMAFDEGDFPAQAVVLDGWQPIETAPDGEVVDLFFANGERLTGFKRDRFGRFCREEGYPTFTRVLLAQPTHWMKVPKEPCDANS